MTTVTDTRLPAWYPPERVARYYDLGLWTGEVLTDLVRRNAERDPHGLCVADGRRVLTFADALEESERLAGSLTAWASAPATALSSSCPTGGRLWSAITRSAGSARCSSRDDDLPRVRDPRRRRPQRRQGDHRARHVPAFRPRGMAASVREQVDSIEHVIAARRRTERWASRICSPERPTTAGGPTPATGTSSCSRRARRRARRGPSTRSTRSRPAPARCASASASAQPTAASCRRRSCTTPG